MENGNEGARGIKNVAGEEGQRQTGTQYCIINPLSLPSLITLADHLRI